VNEAEYRGWRPNKSLDASGGSVFRNLLGAAKGALIRAAASTQTLGVGARSDKATAPRKLARRLLDHVAPSGPARIGGFSRGRPARTLAPRLSTPALRSSPDSSENGRGRSLLVAGLDLGGAVIWPSGAQLNAEPDVDPRRESPKSGSIRRAGPRQLA